MMSQYRPCLEQEKRKYIIQRMIIIHVDIKQRSNRNNLGGDVCFTFRSLLPQNNEIALITNCI